jgi:hypothetical protein
VKPFNKGIAAHLKAMLELLDDDHLLFTNVQGIGPIDIVRVNIHTGKVDFYDAKSDRESSHKKRPITEIQKKLGVKHIYINLKKKTFKVKGV